MKHRRFLALASSAACLAFAVSSVWLWQSLSPAKFESSARLAIANASEANWAPDASANSEDAPIDESKILSPEVLSGAALLIADRNVPLALASPFDSVTDYLLGRIQVARPDQGATDEILITCSAASAEESLQILSAVVDAYIDVATTSQAVPIDTPTDESIALQTECDQLAGAVEQKQREIAELAVQQEAAGPTDNQTSTGQPGIDPAALEAELVQARRANSDAQARLAAAQRDLAQNVPAEFVAARIADLPVKTRVLERLNQVKIKQELEQQEAQRQKWSSVYGRNHPRMAELGQHIESLKQQIARFSAEEQQAEQGPTADSAPAAPAAIVLAALETESNGLQAAVRELETRLATARNGSQQQHELVVKLTGSRQELEFLREEHSRVWKQIDTARHNQRDPQATVIEPPGLSSSPIVPQTGLQMSIACVSGMALCLLVIWQYRRLAPVDVAQAAEEQSDAPVRRESPPAARPRFWSEEERQLLRLKLQSAR